jgi:uncharacterized protein (DUF486 family)
MVAITAGFRAASLKNDLLNRRSFPLCRIKCYLPGRADHALCAEIERISMRVIPPSLLPVLMLFASNVFMTFAWYGHLKYKQSWLPLAVMVSWGIAFFEYWLAVPANRWGSAVYTPAQLKTMQEVITLVVFAGFSVLYLKEPLGWNHALGFLLIAIGAFLIFHKWS